MIKLILPVMFLIVGCSSQSLTDYKNEEPKVDIQTFFSGDVKALGIVQDRSGKVIKRFSVDIKSSWVNDTGTLDETFYYSDKTTSKRIWTLVKQKDGSYTGEAGDIVGKAKGEGSGNTFLFDYTMAIPVDGTVYNVHVADWLYLLDKKTLLARSYMTKFGFDIGEITLVMTNDSL